MLDNWEGKSSFRSSLVIGRGLENIKLEDYCLMKSLNLYFFFSAAMEILIRKETALLCRLSVPAGFTSLMWKPIQGHHVYTRYELIRPPAVKGSTKASSEIWDGLIIGLLEDKNN